MIKRDRIIRGDRGFTLVELLITVVIIAILTAIAIPAYISVVASSQDSAAKQNLSSAIGAQDIYTNSNTTAGTYTNVAGLHTAGLITFGDPSKIQIAAGNGCFVAAALSATGKIFYVTDKNRTPTTTDPGTGCATLPPFPGVVDTSNILAYTIDTTAPGCGLNYAAPIAGVNGATVDWGDATAVQTIYSSLPAHTYAVQGVYNVKVTGTVPTFGAYNYANSTQCTTAVTKWGQGTGTTSARAAFFNATLLTSVVTPPSTITGMPNMFYGASSFNQPINFDTSNVTDMSYMFDGASALNQPLTFSSTANVTNMAYMFYNTTVFNQNIKAWNVAQVSNSSAFRYGSALTLANSPF